MVAIPFPCNCILLITGNLPRVILVLTLKYASFLITHFDLLFYFMNDVSWTDLSTSYTSTQLCVDN